MRLSEEHAALLDNLITIDEVTAAIKGLKNGKSPGNDGRPAEFYKRYVQRLAPPLTSTLNDILSSGFSLRFGTWPLVVLPKKDRDLLNVKSYRPVSLLIQDYKIFMAILTKRLTFIIPHYIHMDLMGFIPNWDIMDHIYKTLDLINYSKSKFISPLLILSLDIEKAFDQVETHYLHILMEHMRAGPSFWKALRTIYDHPTAQVFLHGSISSFFSIFQGTRQGCPLSPLLFALALELLAKAL